jgi:transcription elongation factor Elf1
MGGMKTTSENFPFSSECPHCGHERMQGGLPREELVQLLRSGAQLEAYCASCDEAWSVSVEERADLARALERAK